MKDFAEKSILEASIERIQAASRRMGSEQDRDRAKRTIAHLRARIEEIDYGVKAPAFQMIVRRVR